MNSIVAIFRHLRTKLGAEFIGYFVASAIALAVDMLLLIQLVKLIHPLAAATIAFLVGLLVCYALTVRFVFTVRRFGSQRGREAGIFFLIGIVGLGVNDVVIYLFYMVMTIPLIPSKAAAAVISFILNFTARKFLLFRAAR